MILVIPYFDSTLHWFLVEWSTRDHRGVEDSMDGSCCLYLSEYPVSVLREYHLLATCWQLRFSFSLPSLSFLGSPPLFFSLCYWGTVLICFGLFEVFSICRHARVIVWVFLISLWYPCCGHVPALISCVYLYILCFLSVLGWTSIFPASCGIFDDVFVMCMMPGTCTLAHTYRFYELCESFLGKIVHVRYPYPNYLRIKY